MLIHIILIYFLLSQFAGAMSYIRVRPLCVHCLRLFSFGIVVWLNSGTFHRICKWFISLGMTVVFRSLFCQRNHFHHFLHGVLSNYLVLIEKLFTVCLHLLTPSSVIICFTHSDGRCLILLVVALLIILLDHHIILPTLSNEFVTWAEICFNSLFLSISRLCARGAIIILVNFDSVFRRWLDRFVVYWLF